jgi:hypothetical protein
VLEAEGISVTFLVKKMFGPRLHDALRIYAAKVTRAMSLAPLNDPSAPNAIVSPFRCGCFGPTATAITKLTGEQVGASKANPDDEAQPTSQVVMLGQRAAIVYEAMYITVATVESSQMPEILTVFNEVINDFADGYLAPLKTLSADRSLASTKAEEWIAAISDTRAIGEDLLLRLQAHLVQIYNRPIKALEQEIEQFKSERANLVLVFAKALAAKALGTMNWGSSNYSARDLGATCEPQKCFEDALVMLAATRSKMLRSSVPQVHVKAFMAELMQEVSVVMSASPLGGQAETELGYGGLQQLVLNVKTLVAATTVYLSPAAQKNLLEGVIEKAVALFKETQKVGKDGALQADDWFQKKVNSKLVQLKKQLGDFSSG